MFVRWKTFLASTLLGAATLSSASAQSDRPFALGVYDPTQAFQGQSAISVEHVFISWVGLDKAWFRSVVQYATDRSREMMITVEPFRRAGEAGTPDSYLTDIVAGKYRKETYSTCRAIGSLNAPVLVRWGHEMDDTSGRYPWAGATPSIYIRAFRHFVTACRRAAPQAIFTWSPLASTDPNRYYPGDQYVDRIGLPIWALQQLDMDYWGRPRTFSELVNDKYKYIKDHKKPVIVAEFGISGDAAYKLGVLSGLQAAKPYIPLVTAVSYFNMKEPFPWWGSYGTPDWRIDPALFSLPAVTGVALSKLPLK